VAGVSVLLWLLYRIGLVSLLRSLSELGWGFLLVFALHSLSIAFNSASWRAVLPWENRGMPWTSLAPLRVAGDAVNTVAPTALVGGELVRVSLLSRSLPVEAAAVSVTLAAMSQCLGQIVFIVSGISIAMTFVQGRALRLGIALFAVALVALFFGILAFAKWGLSLLGRGLDRLGWFRAWSASGGKRWRALIGETVAALRDDPAALARSVAAAFLAWQAGVVETFVILLLLKAPVGWRQAFSIEVLAVAIEGVFFFVPAKVGAQEGGKVLIFLMMGLDPAEGLALGLVRRLRELAWAIVGLGVLAYFQRRGRPHPSMSSMARP
jgi:uncharacterized protein (TIRG00374 family)